MVRGEEAVATADEKMGEADGGRGRRRARRRIASGGRGRPWTTAPTTPSRGGETLLHRGPGRSTRGGHGRMYGDWMLFWPCFIIRINLLTGLWSI
jgi:hypothetical protein